MSLKDLGIKGVTLSGAFAYDSPNPIDLRTTVEDITTRDGLITNNCVYAGMIVYVKSQNKHYKCCPHPTKEDTFIWEEFNSSGSVQSNWEETNENSAAFIKNKPDVIVEGDARLTDARTPVAHEQAATSITEDTDHRFVTDSEKEIWGAKQEAITVTNKLSSAYIDGLATVATSGNYADLLNIPGCATADNDGFMSKTDKENLDLIVNSFNSEDADSTINTVKEVLKAFENSPEGTDIANALAAKQDEIKISGTVTKDLGGITKDKIYTDATVADILKDLLFASVAPVFTRIKTSESAGTYEYGDTVTISTVTPDFICGSKPITSIKIGTTLGGNDLYEGSSAISGTAITLTNSKVYNGTTGGNIYCAISDGEFTVDASAGIGYTYYTYYAVTDTTEKPDNWKSVGSSSLTGITISAKAGQYIWIATTTSVEVSANHGICEFNELGQSYNSPASTYKFSNQTLTNSQNNECSGVYNFYRLDEPRKKDGAAKFKLM
jgi:hypothetical protein